MKSARSIGKARNARLNRAIREAEALVRLLKTQQGIEHRDAIQDAEFWFDARAHVAELTQCFHEANAYNNAMVPDGESFERDEYGPKGAVTPRHETEGK